MAKFISLLFVPQEKNNHRALLLKPSFLGIFIAIYLLNQSILHSLTVIKPGVLGYSSEITIQKVLDQTNAVRQKQGLSLLQYNVILSQSATAKAQDMFANNYWAHNSPQGKTPWDFFKAAGYQYSIAGENLAKDFYDTETLMQAWMNSPTHRENILSPKYQEIGIGVVNGILNGVKTTLVVQHFGTPLNGEIAKDLPPSTINNNVSPETALVQSPVSNTLAAQSTAINPILISKIISGIIFLLIISVLIVDSYITLKNQTHRLTGSAASHIGFLIIILMLLIFSQQGTIF
ncbi:MAG: CAP domain-containing protein [Candidatus Shapirobacteria bacterium]|jgi:hypothetical protein